MVVKIPNRPKFAAQGSSSINSSSFGQLSLTDSNAFECNESLSIFLGR